MASAGGHSGPDRAHGGTLAPDQAILKLKIDRSIGNQIQCLRRGKSRPTLFRMSIATRTGDDGTTGLMYNRRTLKHSLRVDAYGAVDELNAALGLARCAIGTPHVKQMLLALQNDLVVIMGELATLPEDLPRYERDGFHRVTPALKEKLDRGIAEIEAERLVFRGWSTPGDGEGSARLEVARTVCRRAERRTCQLLEEEPPGNREILVYLNRSADLLWLLAQWVRHHLET